ncbi:MAG: membrane integrity-associated transporter subunit PqiC [Sulfuritalea sp.]|nr:membrane integrity-associated transporter subunit PqiC [Sulfuritalea sp.]
MSKLFLTLLAGALLSACGGGPRVSEPTRYDLGVPAGAAATWRLHLGATDVQAASWLASTAMHYRLAYAEPLRRQSYGESRWVAPPAELLESVLKRRQVAAETNGPGCRLQLVLDEFEQRFDTPQSSQVVLEARGVLLPARGSDMLARRAFRIVKPARTADARGGAAAAREAAMALADELAAWSNELASAKAAVAERCRN